MFFLFFLPLVFCLSCNKQDATAIRMFQENAIAPRVQYPFYQCSNFTTIKPPLDLLFLWDNSSSKQYLTSQLQQQLAETFNQVALAQFDYRIFLAPIQKSSSGASEVYDGALIADTPPSNLNSVRILNSQQAIGLLHSFPTVTGSREHGVKRSLDLIRSLHQLSIFRKKSHLAVILMSNGDDSSNTDAAGFAIATRDREFVEQKTQEFTSLKNFYQHQQLRFLSLTAHSRCQGYSSPSFIYQTLSKELFTQVPEALKGPQDNMFQDAYNLCSGDFSNLFSSINSQIKAIVLNNQYDYWPISEKPNLRFDPRSIKVFKETKQGSEEIFSVEMANGGSGYQYIGFQQNINLKKWPIAGEPFTGHVLKLFGNAIVIYPDCLRVETLSPTDYYGYIHLKHRPFEQSIKLRINGREIPQSNVNGWAYIGERNSLNLKIRNPLDPSTDPEFEPDLASGFFLQLHGEAIYKNGARIDLDYLPAGDY